MISDQLAAFADRVRFQDVPPEVARTAKYLILDAVGIALASTTYAFGRNTIKALTLFGGGDSAVIGSPIRLALRDAVLANGVLIHGLDFDDTHTVALVHATSGCFSTALGVAEHANATGRDLLSAYIVGMEVAARIGMVAKGQFQQVGFHPTGVVAAFACALIAGKLLKLDQRELVMAQGIALSMASGSREYTTDASGTKRLHPGWAGVSGISAAMLAKGGFTGPRTAYEGRHGLYATHLPGSSELDLGPATRQLGEAWETLQVAIKPYPVGHFNVAFIDAAIALVTQHEIQVDDIADIEALVPPHAVKIVCEPAAIRKRPRDSYAAQFSIQYAIACALITRKFGLNELERYDDPAILALADKVRHSPDAATGYPRHLSGEVIITMKNGARFSHREQINRGAPDNPVSAADIVAKFVGNAELAVSRARAEEIRNAILAIDEPAAMARDLARICALDPA
ncbi:MAG TPA: MmgE/PrpD family protein [Burkholderiales bacterium]|nr:MmgE/PrpD family protein [Burkholderiales bacterium]